MKNFVRLLLICALLTGCAAEDTFETVSDNLPQSAAAPMAEIVVSLPEEAAAPASQTENGALYQCDGYEILVETFTSGDLDATLRSTTGYSREDLTVIETRNGKIRRYDLVWSCLGEQGEHVGRACVLDDGNYHYVLSVLADAARAGELERDWEELFGSYALG